jgi:alpha-L-fucosidase 2
LFKKTTGVPIDDPCDLIKPTPAACDESTGWAKAWRINLWARLLDGNHAYKMYRELLSYTDPDAWPEGSVKGICTRGGFVIDMEWKDKSLTKVSIYAKTDAKTKVISGNKQKEIELKSGEKIEFDW